jgi:type 1 glutamine amidotransferase
MALANQLLRYVSSLIALACVFAGSAAMPQTPPKLPQAITLPKMPDKTANGQRPWPELPETEVAKLIPVLPEKPEVPPKQPRKLLVFYRADGFPHGSIPHWNKLIQLMGEKTGAYEATLSQDYDDLLPERLSKYDAIFCNNTVSMQTPPDVKTSIQAFIRGGKGYAGNHGSGDNWHDWPEGLEMIGAEFTRHPFGRVLVKIDDPSSPLTAMFGGKSFPFDDEIYAFSKPYSRDGVRVLLSIDYDNSPEVQKTEARIREKNAPKDVASLRDDRDYALAWIKPWQKGRVFYCAFGHRAEVTFDPNMVRFFLAGIQYALGDLSANDQPLGQPASAVPPAAIAPPAAKVE